MKDKQALIDFLEYVVSTYPIVDEDIYNRDDEDGEYILSPDEVVKHYIDKSAIVSKLPHKDPLHNLLAKNTANPEWVICKSCLYGSTHSELAAHGGVCADCDERPFV